jgi:chloramphenicol 3-O-phosphotransferase
MIKTGTILFLNMGIDTFIWMIPERYLNRPLWDDVPGKATEAGQARHTLFSGMHLVHRYSVYDLELDRSTLTPQECASRVIARLETPPQAVKRLLTH